MMRVIERDKEAGTLTIRSADAAIEFSDLEYPHDDALALYRVALSGDGLHASGSVEAVGDDGLAEFLREISVSVPWEGQRTWRALTALEVSAVVNDRGNVSTAFRLDGRAWDPPWSANCRFEFDLGEVATLSTEARDWFSADAPE